MRGCFERFPIASSLAQFAAAAGGSVQLYGIERALSLPVSRRALKKPQPYRLKRSLTSILRIIVADPGSRQDERHDVPGRTLFQ